MTDYALSTDIQTYVGTTLSSASLGNAVLALTAASRAVDSFTGRDFTPSGNTATTMSFAVRSLYRGFVRDFSTTADLVVALDEDEDGTAETTLTAADYQLYPLNAYIPGVGTASYTEVRLVGRDFTQCNRRPTLHVTAKWGWTAVPDVIKRATVMLAAEMLKDPETPYGVVGFDNVGVIRLRANPRVAMMLQPYVRPEQAVMVG